jgi:hypothetical protein
VYRYADLAGEALRDDLRRGELMAGGAFQIMEDGERYISYLDGGGAGLAIVMGKYLRVREDAELSAILAGIRRACHADFVRQPGLFAAVPGRWRRSASSVTRRSGPRSTYICDGWPGTPAPTAAIWRSAAPDCCGCRPTWRPARPAWSPR